MNDKVLIAIISNISIGVRKFEGMDKSYILRIVKLIFLSSKIQEKILLLPRFKKHRAYISAKDLLKLVEIVGFEEQERVFEKSCERIDYCRIYVRIGFLEGTGDCGVWKVTSLYCLYIKFISDNSWPTW